MSWTDELETPQKLFDKWNAVFRFSLDVCASAQNTLCERYYSLEDSALAHSWSGEVVWLNPPYSNPGPFLAKAPEALATVALVKGDPSTRWWNAFVKSKAQVLWLPKRIKFFYKGEPTKYAASFPSAILLYLENLCSTN